MVIVVFEFEPIESLKDRYFELATALREEVGKIDGFISVERFESINNAGRFVSLSTWQDMAAVKRWREHLQHSAAQDEAKSRNIFRDYRIRVAEVVRDYGKGESA
ncbi:MAG: antibiotic biosynthesis monooxygenase [Proteobacteria bacterium]|jgi:heme-degrading monooxygenase HmoA|nr:antibiotic biosynthesis monooxygenase [Pseudomonadota bacterium]MBP09546.1 antibiotic biosynthesis monooxygenase [Acidiferrobacteraceae bacterium]MDP6135207.1 antibiotic biosynthesis monooxygenase [Arenicellales bacterium]MDP6392437.1 antibiotic biosynthesis monooxygenase [Arenicellales bacterium]MDP7218037.1 antibiotic biosynthesis monooxygenase [Arenicellales bacterium]|tara:strand:+ start:183 stop:497 length:315 start_codon:yes stop_codon:yes gene_type:complete